MSIAPGDIVVRRSYDQDICFRVVKINEDSDEAELSGEDLRLYADAPLTDLIKVSEESRKEYEKQNRRRENDTLRLFRQDYQSLKMKREYTATGGYSAGASYFELPGRVLHIDGDPLYLRKCLKVYERLGVPVVGKHIPETDMAEQVPALTAHIRPDILVLTGHDAYMKHKGEVHDIKAYRHSAHFIRSVQEIRYQFPNLDQLVIFAGACQSHFERLIRSGANFASSPKRINIHALDPVYLVARLSFTSFMERVNVWEVLRSTISGSEGLGGVETRGLLRTGLPYSQPPAST